MSNSILILGESGSGKTASLRNLDPDKCLLIQPVSKQLPFPNNSAWKNLSFDENGVARGSVTVLNDYSKIKQAIEFAPLMGKEIVIIDDFQYLMVNEFMGKAEVKGFDKFTQIGMHVWNLLNTCISAPPTLRIYFLSHIEAGDYGRLKMKTIGKMLDEKVVVEGMFTIVLRASLENGRHLFRTKNSGSDTTKSPMGMFDSDYIDNDLKLVDDVYKKYYGIN